MNPNPDIHRRVFAPGKLFLFGEYAVIAGGWSVVTAVPVGVHTDYNPKRNIYGVRFEDEIKEGPRYAKLANLVLREAKSALNVNHIETDTRQVYVQGKGKLGVGSSAASCVSVATLALPEASASVRFGVAARAHKKFQHGRGSHADVASSTFGGTIMYRLTDPVPPFEAITSQEFEKTQIIEFAELRPLEKPDKLEIYGYWLGAPANSRSKLARLESALHRSEVNDAIDEIKLAAEHGIQGYLNDSSCQVMEAVKWGREAMFDLQYAAGILIWIEEATRLKELLRGMHVEIKMSGAGGGDFAVVFGEKGVTDWEKVKQKVPGFWLKLEGDVPGSHAVHLKT